MKAQLSESWIFNGVTYGPGEADLPPDAHAAIGGKGGFPLPEAAPEDSGPSDPPADQGDAAPTGQGGEPQLPQGAIVPPTDDPIAKAVGAEAAAALREAGFGAVAALRAADDATLLEVPGIGRGRLERLRAIPAETE